MNCLKALPVKHGLSRLSCPPLLTPTVLVGSLIAPHPSISVNFSPNDSRWSKDHFVSVFLHDNTILEQKWCVVWIYLFCQGNSSEDHSWSDKFQLVLQVARKVQVGIPPFYSYHHHHHHHHHHRHYHFAYSLCLLLFFVCFFLLFWLLNAPMYARYKKHRHWVDTRTKPWYGQPRTIARFGLRM